jgi:hypothetical protein
MLTIRFQSAAGATIVKLTYIIRVWNPAEPPTDLGDMWSNIGISTVVEHGASIFACSVLALRPLLQKAAKTFSGIYASSKNSDSKASKSGNNTHQSYELLLHNRRTGNSNFVNAASASNLGGSNGDPNFIVETRTVTVESHSMV